MDSTLRSKLTSPAAMHGRTPELAAPLNHRLRGGEADVARHRGRGRDGFATTTSPSRGGAGDATRDADGVFVYLRDLETAAFGRPDFSRRRAERRRVRACEFSPGRAVFRRVDDGIRVEMDVCVVASSDVELRRITMTNEAAGRGGWKSRRIWSGCCKTPQPTRRIRRSRNFSSRRLSSPSGS